MPTDQLSATFAALADPTRRAILARLVSGGRSVTELAEPFEMSLPAVSKHLRVLADWAERYRDIWEKRLDRLDDYLQELKTKELKTKEKKHGRQSRRK
jgi:DNA-binding transcriptional ArsR family regulator